MTGQFAEERASVGPTPGQVGGGRTVMLIPHREPGVEEDSLPWDYQRIITGRPLDRMGLASAGDTVAARWRDDPQEAVALVLELTAGGELAVDEVLEAAVDAVAVCGLLTLSEARTVAVSEPSRAAETICRPCRISLAVTLASADLD
ncbi:MULTISPECIES: hypothetical protein [unclassified Streptomyces]|uniref:hypothetical protein n=1 Tax=unclassified Streptomyces TaxID=2593676 RepID=UPI00331BE546